MYCYLYQLTSTLFTLAEMSVSIVAAARVIVLDAGHVTSVKTTRANAEHGISGYFPTAARRATKATNGSDVHSD